MAIGTVEGTSMTTIAEPGMSQLPLNNLQLPQGGIVSLPGPTGPVGPVSIVSTPCLAPPPHTTLVCGASNQLQLLFCDFQSNSTQQGNIYMCVGTSWDFYGTVGPNSTAGPPGIGIYAATCSGGPPPTSITEPVYTCNAAFKLNMVLCDLPSLNNNVGLVYQCLCAPTCGWVQVANLNGQGPATIGYWQYGVAAFSNTHQVWNTIMQLPSIPVVGYYSCIFEGSVSQYSTTISPCPLEYGISSAPATGLWIENSNRQVNVGPASGSYAPTVTIFTTAAVEVSTAPETIYVTAGINGAATGCANWQPNNDVAQTLRCLRINGNGYGNP